MVGFYKVNKPVSNYHAIREWRLFLLLLEQECCFAALKARGKCGRRVSAAQPGWLGTLTSKVPSLPTPNLGSPSLLFLLGHTPLLLNNSCCKWHDGAYKIRRSSHIQHRLTLPQPIIPESRYPRMGCKLSPLSRDTSAYSEQLTRRTSMLARGSFQRLAKP